MGSSLVGSQQHWQSHTRTGGGGGGGGGLELELDDSVLPELEDELLLELSDELLELDEELKLGGELLELEDELELDDELLELDEDGEELELDELLDRDELDDEELGAELDEEELLGGALLLELDGHGGMIPLDDDEELGAEEELEDELELDGKLLELDEELLELDMIVTPISPPCGFVGQESSGRILNPPKCYPEIYSCVTLKSTILLKISFVRSCSLRRSADREFDTCCYV